MPPGTRRLESSLSPLCALAGQRTERVRPGGMTEQKIRFHVADQLVRSRAILLWRILMPAVVLDVFELQSVRTSTE
jgi:hypothetical protein